MSIVAAPGPRYVVPRTESIFRPDIEGLRGIAVLIVVAFHCGVKGFGGGFIGVDVFFALSGYLITGLLLKEVESTSEIRLVHFYARRARRLLPASALMLAVTIAAAALVFAPQELKFAAQAARATAVYLSNMFFLMNAADYFAPGVETNPLLHTWSLAIEEQFYFFWPVLILVTFRWKRSRTGVFRTLSVITLASFALSVWMTYRNAPAAFYSLPSRAWEFGIGGLAAMVPAGRLNRWSSGWISMAGIGLAVIACAAVLTPEVHFPGWIAVVPVAGTILVLVAGSEWASNNAASAGPSAFLRLAPLQYLGKLSYSWYLWHWPFLVVAKALLPSVSTAGRCIAAALAFGMAALSYRMLERPIRFHPKLVKRPILTLGFAAVLTVFSVLTAFVAIRFAGTLEKRPSMRVVATAIEDVADMPREQCVSLGNTAEVKTCFFGNADAATTIVLFGDSHAIQWFNALHDLAANKRWRLATKLKSGCPATDIVPPNSDNSFARACTEWRARSIAEIVGLRPSLVIVASASKYLDRDRANSAAPIEPGQWRVGTRRMLEPFNRAHLPVAVIADTPHPPYDVPSCLGRSIRHGWYPGGTCEFLASDGLRPAAADAERTAATGLNEVSVLVMTDLFCEGQVCPSVRNGTVVYRDDNHMTGTFARSLSTALGSRLMPLIRSRQE